MRFLIFISFCFHFSLHIKQKDIIITKSNKMQLGQQVLNKISDLLVQIDRPKSPKRRKIQRQEAHQVSYNNDNRLYQNYKRLRDRAHERQKDKIKQQMEKLQGFKVGNKHSIFLNSRNNLRPIHERTQQILRERQLSIEKKRTQINLQRQRQKQLRGYTLSQEQENYDQIQRSKQPRRVATKQELDQILKRLTQRERQRNEKTNRQKMDYLKQKLMNNRQKPSLNKKSQKIWQKHRQQKQLSNNVFQRFDKYIWDHKKHRQQYINAIKQKETPFRPKISKNSIQMLNKSSASRVSLNKQLDRSTSCKCFAKHSHSQRSINPNHNLSKHKHTASTHQHTKSQVSLSPYRYEGKPTMR